MDLSELRECQGYMVRACLEKDGILGDPELLGNIIIIIVIIIVIIKMMMMMIIRFITR